MRYKRSWQLCSLAENIVVASEMWFRIGIICMEYMVITGASLQMECMWWRHIVAGLLKTQIVSSVKAVRSDRMAARWRHRMETYSALLAICAGNSPVTGEFPAQRPVTRSFDFSFDLLPKNGWVNNPEAGDLRKKSRPLWRHGNNPGTIMPEAGLLVPGYWVVAALGLLHLIGNQDKRHTGLFVMYLK